MVLTLCFKTNSGGELNRLKLDVDILFCSVPSFALCVECVCLAHRVHGQIPLRPWMLHGLKDLEELPEMNCLAFVRL